jgi:ABC-type transport system involved in multi-copper enzyme maturation permease subunit
MWGSFRAETIKAVKRPATWLLAAIGWILSLIFTYLVPYAGYVGDTGGPTSDRLLSDMLPANLVGNSIAGLPVFYGAIMIILGVLVVGGEYGWGTWKTVLVQGPSRMAVFGGKLAVLAVTTLGVLLGTFALGAVASVAIAAAESQPVHWPGLADLVTGVGAGWLIAMMWGAFGGLLAVALRGVALAVGLGLVWALAVQNLLAGIAAPLLDWVAQMQKGLPGPNAGSLVATLGAPADTPGVDALVGSGQATLVLAVYLVAFAAVSAGLLRRRDVL